MPGHRTVLFASFDTSQFKDPEAHYINYENDTNFPIINNVPATLNFELSSRDVSSVEPTINFTSNGIDGLGNILTTFNIPKINFVDQKIYFVARLKDGVIPFKREPLIESTLDFLVTYNTEDTLRLFNTDNESLVLRENDLSVNLITGDTTTETTTAVQFTVTGASNSQYNTTYIFNSTNNRYESLLYPSSEFFIQIPDMNRWLFYYGGTNFILANDAATLPGDSNWPGGIASAFIFSDTITGDLPPTTVNIGTIINSAKVFTNVSSISSTGGGYVRGYVVASEGVKNCKLQLIYKSQIGSFNKTLTAYSDTFDILPSAGVYDVRKINEDNDQTQNYKDLIYQEVLLDKPSFFNGLLGQSVGSKNSSPETLGIKTFEKSANFVANSSDPDYCNIKALLSMFNSMEIDFEDYNQQFPPSLTRLVDILSVSPSKQMPKQNQYQLNFDDKGFTSKTVFGKNRGDYLPLETTTLYTGEDSKYILAYEKFSENYTLVNTNILSAVNVNYTGINSYALSSYNDTWGWGLVVPKDTTGIDVLDYYEFYDYNNTIDGTIMEDFIDYTNSKCTYLQAVTSYNQIMDKDGIADNLLQYNLYANCGLIGEEVIIPATSIANNASIYNTNNNTNNSSNTSTYNTSNTGDTGNSNQSSPGYY